MPPTDQVTAPTPTPTPTPNPYSNQVEQVQRVFRLFDTDGSGSIDAKVV